MDAVKSAVLGAGLRFGGDTADDLKRVRNQAEDGELYGWTGGEVWLVPTDQPVHEWRPIAARVL